jgi:predicted nucleotidyltransferase
MRLSKTLQKIDLSTKLDKLNEYFTANERIMAVYLFGSYGTVYQTPLSDVDFGVLTIEKTTFDEELKILADFTGLLEEDDINIVFFNKADLVIQHNILATGRLLYCRDQLFLADFIEYINKRYCDFRIDLDRFNIDYDLGLKEEFLNGR